jgi:putative peptide maturation dehydrogenase
MAKVRRSSYAFFYLEDAYEPDLATVLRGKLPAPAPVARISALSVLSGERHELSRAELELLLSVPTERWIESDGRDGDVLRDLTEKGLLLSDREDSRCRALRDREDALAANEWNPYAALYHYLTQWTSVDIREPGKEEYEITDRTIAIGRAFVAEHGPPPGEFAEERGARSLPLPGAEQEGALFRTLTARRTTRAFDAGEPMTLEQLGAVLRYVFGCHGYGRTISGVLCIKRTSPSGGALHAIEAYPIISNVTGVQPGIYHYNVHDHALTLLSELEPAEARKMATTFMCGQSYFGAAHVSFVLTARFYRNHWKYRRHQKAYAGLLMDAAHLSQTLYLVSGELGLGAFVTIAINGRDIEERLDLDGVSEGVIAMTGCGPKAPGESPLELHVSSEPGQLTPPDSGVSERRVRRAASTPARMPLRS